MKETISRSDDALVIEIVAGDKTSRLRYVRLTDTGACESWPNPCKKAGACQRRVFTICTFTNSHLTKLINGNVQWS